LRVGRRSGAVRVGWLREAWAAYRYGPEIVAHGGAVIAGRVDAPLERRLLRSIALYDAFVEQRPPGWPLSGAGAVCALASQKRAACLAGDIARLEGSPRACRADTGRG
jgi:hypothetical protein